MFYSKIVITLTSCCITFHDVTKLSSTQLFPDHTVSAVNFVFIDKYFNMPSFFKKQASLSNMFQLESEITCSCFLNNSVDIDFTSLAQCLCHIHVVTFNLISNSVIDYIQRRRGEPGLFSFEYNLSPKLISK